MPVLTKDPALADHLAWLGYVQPEGLVVSAPALVDAQAIIDRAQLGDLQRRFADHVSDLPVAESDTADTQPGIADVPRFFTEFLGWPADYLVAVDDAHPLAGSLAVALPEFQETLRPNYAVRNPHAKEGASPWLLLVQSHSATVDLDKPAASSERHWHASPSKKFERLLRETGVPVGLLTNGTQFRLIYAPPKENSGALTFPVGAMADVSGRLILGAFQLLLGGWTLFTAPSDARLPALLQRSRDYQASVSEILAEQVLHALYELLRGFEAADERTQGKLLRELAARNPGDIYGGLVTVLLRLVFILFAEDRGLLPSSGLYVRHYAVRGLFERLRADAERYPDTMDHRFGAWAQLLALFRVIYGGCRHPDLQMPARAGHLFDPDRYLFLEGRSVNGEWGAGNGERGIENRAEVARPIRHPPFPTPFPSSATARSIGSWKNSVSSKANGSATARSTWKKSVPSIKPSWVLASKPPPAPPSPSRASARMEVCPPQWLSTWSRSSQSRPRTVASGLRKTPTPSSPAKRTSASKPPPPWTTFSSRWRSASTATPRPRRWPRAASCSSPPMNVAAAARTTRRDPLLNPSSVRPSNRFSAGWRGRGVGKGEWGMGEMDHMSIQSYRDLEVWQRGRALVKAVYQLTLQFPAEEKYGLKSQMRRAAVSIPSNIAEGWARHYTAEYIQFLRTANGSRAELETQLLLSQDLEMASEVQVKPLLQELEILGRQLLTLERRLRP